MAQVFGSDLASVSVGDPAEVVTGVDCEQCFPERSTTFRRWSIPNTRSVLVRVVVDNPGRFLKKQMYVRVLIQARQESSGLLIPVSAILRDDENLPFVYVAQPDGSFARQHVTLGYRSRRSVRHSRRPQGRRPDRGRRRHLRSVHAEANERACAADRSGAAHGLDHEPDRGLVAAAAFLVDPDDARADRRRHARSLQRLPVDAYPDLSPPMVEIITQWPGHAAEEVERLITVPVELGMNGIPQTTTTRSISLYGLSDVILTFDNGTDNYFARQQVFNRLRRSQPAERRRLRRCRRCPRRRV